MTVVPCCRFTVTLFLILLIIIWRLIIQNGDLAHFSYKHYTNVVAKPGFKDISTSEEYVNWLSSLQIELALNTKRYIPTKEDQLDDTMEDENYSNTEMVSFPCLMMYRAKKQECGRLDISYQ